MSFRCILSNTVKQVPLFMKIKAYLQGLAKALRILAMIPQDERTRYSARPIHTHISHQCAATTNNGAGADDLTRSSTLIELLACLLALMNIV